MITLLRRGCAFLLLGCALAATTVPATAATTPLVRRPAIAQAISAAGWHLVKRISARGQDVLMVGVAAVRADDAWALGEVSTDDSLVPRVERWNGAAWQRVTLPGRVTNYFDDTDLWDAFGASSARNLWAFTVNGHYLRLHGTRWTAGPVPHAGVIEAAKVFSSRDVWVFGAKRIGGTQFNPRFGPWAANFNGREWRTIPVPGRADISAVSAVSRDDILAVTGAIDSASGAAARPRVLHWDGKTWTAETTQPRLSKRATIYAILADSDADVWIGGSTPISSKQTSDIVQHFDGTSWGPATPPAAGSGSDDLVASLVRDGRGGLWGLGLNLSPGDEQLWHYSGGSWSAPVRLPWPISQLAAVPRSTVTWATGSDKIRGHYVGVIVMHGATR